MAIVRAVALTRRVGAALAGAAAAVLACAALGVVLGPVLVAQVAGDALHVVVGVALLLFGMEWLRRGVVRLAGRRARSDSYAEFVAEREALSEAPPPVAGGFDWPGFVVSFKGVLLEGVEVILIVTVLAARPGGRGPAAGGRGGWRRGRWAGPRRSRSCSGWGSSCTGRYGACRRRSSSTWWGSC